MSVKSGASLDFIVSVISIEELVVSRKDVLSNSVNSIVDSTSV